MNYWCLHFDRTVEDLALTHGLDESLWLMQYQYSHDEQICQGGDQLSQTSRNWDALRRINVWDRCVAYNAQPTRFYAIGEITEPKRRERHFNKPVHQDTIERTISEHQHLYFDGVVYYAESSVFYEDFTDDWNLVFEKEGKPEVYKYPQRIDVREWLHIVPSGIYLKGLKAAAKSGQLIGSAIIEINKEFFDAVSAELSKVQS